MRRVYLDTDFLAALLRSRPEAVKRAEEYDSIKAEAPTTLMNAFDHPSNVAVNLALTSPKRVMRIG